MTNNKGFTLVELMISVAMTGIILAAVYSVYTLQQKTYTAQDQVVEMQQNIRSAMLTMIPEIRMAGYNPSPDPFPDTKAKFLDATVSTLSFEQDITDATGDDSDGDGNLGDPNEKIGYGFVSGVSETKGFVDASGVAKFGRKTGAGSLQPIAENIQAIEFLYTMEDGNETTSPGTLPNIRTITISILARAAKRDAKFINNTIYTTASGDEWGLNGKTTPPMAAVPFNDNYRRRLLITTVQCRNMGL